MKNLLLLSLALSASMMIAAPAVKSLNKNARALPVSNKVEKVSDMSKLHATNTVCKSGSQVVASQKLKNGSAVQYVKASDGTIQKRLVMNDNKLRVSSKASKKFISTKAATAPSFFEGFEGWDGETRDWIPANWQDVSKVGTLPGVEGEMNLTWSANDGAFGVPPEGNYYCRVQVSTPGAAEDGTPIPAVQQDEWLITPAITVGADENLSFYLSYHPGWTLLDMNTFEFTGQNNILEVLISDNNGTNWTKVWDCLADAKSYTEDELMNDLFTMSDGVVIYVPIKMKEYEGKSVQIAFRYVGIDGESMCIDAVKMGVPSPEAYYLPPYGYFNNGLSMDYSSSTGSWLLGAAYTDSEWFNASNNDSESFAWTFSDPDNDYNSAVTNDVNLIVNYPYAQVDAPLLTASAPGAADGSYIWHDGKGFIQTGGNNEITFTGDTEPTVLGACNYDLTKKFMSLTVSEGKYAFGTGSNEWWAGLYGADAANLKSIANYFEQPEHPYFVTTMWVSCDVLAEPDAEFKLTVHRVVDGSVKDIIAESTCTGADIVKANDGYYSIPFTFTVKDPVTGLESDTYLDIEDAILVELSGFQSPKVSMFSPFMQSGANDDGTCWSYYFIETTSKGETATSLESTSGLRTSEGPLNSAFLFNMDATYTWMFTNEEAKFEAPVDGGSKDFVVNSYFYSSAWAVAEEEDGTLPEYVKVSMDDNETTGLSTLTVTVDPLGAGETGRGTKFTLYAPGASQEFEIVQGDYNSVSATTVNPVKVVATNGDFSVSYPSTVSSVKVYTVSGQLVNEYALPETGSYVISAQGLVKGMYIFKFNDNNVCKAIK